MQVDCIDKFPIIVTYGKAECGFIVFVKISTKTHINTKHHHHHHHHVHEGLGVFPVP
jgi:hypothetical protein